MNSQKLINKLTLICFGFILLSSNIHGQIFEDQATELGVIATAAPVEFGNGLSTFDFNQDGLDDITLSNKSGNIHFYENTGEGFELVDFGVVAPGETKQVLWVDYDNDSDQDILITTLYGRNVLYQNQGDFTFQDVTLASGLPVDTAFNSGASFGDYDLDGDLDLYIAKYIYGDFDANDSTQYNRLYRNEGNGTFTDVTVSSGIRMPPTLSFQPVWFDYNGDNWPDLFVINDRDPSNYFFVNSGNGTFHEIAENLDMDFPEHDIMSNSMSDFDHDGDLDVFMTNTGASVGQTRHMLAKNNGDGTYTESAVEYGLELFDFSWGALWIDADNDSWDDLLFVTPDDGPIYFYESLEGAFFSQNNDQVLVDNHRTSYCPGRGDFNNDGYSDIAIQCEFPNISYVLMNQGGENDFIKITLEGVVSNKDAIGAWIKVYLENEVYSKYTFSGENYHGQNSQHLIFGLGPEVDIVDSVLVIYPSGHIDRYYDLPTGVSYNLTEGDTYHVAISSGATNYFCQGDSLLLDAGVHTSYLWESGNTTQYQWASTGNLYTVITENIYGLSSTDTISIEELPNPTLSYIVTPPLCFEDSTGSIAVINLEEVAADSVVWDNGNQGGILENLPAGTYNCVYYDINGCIGMGTSTLFDPPAMQFFATSTPEVSENADGTITITIFGGTEPYEIFLNNELVESPILDLEGDTYSFVIVDANGCSEELTIEVENILGTIDQNKIGISVFPNPAFSSISIDSDLNISTIQIMDISGREVLSFNKNASNKYNLEELPKGHYLLEITFDNSLNTVIRLVKI